MTERGRAGRTRLEQRLVTAGHGALLLDRKDRILTDELERLALREARSRAEWERCSRDAAVWLIRTVALDGRGKIASARPPDRVLATITWGGVVGVGFPEAAEVDAPAPVPAGGSSALSFAAAAHRTAVEAGARYAADRRAVALVTQELTATRVRRRAIENRWIPRLQNNLARVERELAEVELEDMLRLRWADAARTSSARNDEVPTAKEGG